MQSSNTFTINTAKSLIQVDQNSPLTVSSPKLHQFSTKTVPNTATNVIVTDDILDCIHLSCKNFLIAHS